MTCIVGFIDKKSKSVFMGADSAASTDSNIVTRKDPKIFRKGEFIFGCTSSYRMIQLLMFSLKIPDIGSKDIFEFMCTDFVNSIRECFKDGGYMRKSTMGDDSGGNFLVGYKNRLFNIGEDFQVAECAGGIDAAGCGMDFALGSMHSTSNLNTDPKEKVLTALRAAEFLALGVRRPFIVMNT